MHRNMRVRHDYRLRQQNEAKAEELFIRSNITCIYLSRLSSVVSHGEMMDTRTPPSTYRRKDRICPSQTRQTIGNIEWYSRALRQGNKDDTNPYM
ncbi:hypothetical protein LB506_000205 [Fusarium annulatum]|nr:hypothetical protein LB506_000205 [Fusarium annulatum]